MAVKPVWQATAADINGIEYVIKEHLNEGAIVDLRLGLEQALTADQLSGFQDYLLSGGLDLTEPVKMVAGPWPNTIEIRFRRPSTEGVGFAWGLALMVIGGLAFIGISSFIGWQIGEVIGEIARYLIPVVLIGAGTYLLAKYIEKRA